MKPFLQQVAEIYIANEAIRITDYCFVFPNKRSGKFFAKHLRQASGTTSVQPAITTISDFVLNFSQGVEASRMEQLFILYGIYSKILMQSGDNGDLSFDRFQYWGDIILSDFNDVDRYLVDARELFKNIKDLKEISSNFLTEEQLKVIEEFWGEKRNPEVLKHFWNHTSHNEEGSEIKSKFTRLWEVLYKLYTEFNICLANKDLTYNGRAYRQASENISLMEAHEFPYKRYIFVGFNLLSASEIKIFESMVKLGIGDFYWDTASPTFSESANSAIKFLKRYENRFKSLYNLPEPKIKTFPITKIIGIPSNTGQVKKVGDILTQIRTKGELDTPDNAVKTAIVLPDEQLFIPLLHSISPEIGNINVTMGYPLRHTPVASLISNIVSMQIRSTILHGELHYFFYDILKALSHPLIRNIAPTEADAITSNINNYRRYNLSAKELSESYPSLAPLFTPVKGGEIDSVTTYINNLLDILSIKLNDSRQIEIGFIKEYKQAVATLNHLCHNYNIEMKESTFFHLVERLVGSESVNFVGEPLKGVQIMGVLETRALDFDNVIICSMNERIFPRKHYSSSFIPNNLRRGYGMSTLDFQESIYAYYFYRLISRANAIYLLYDSNNNSRRSGEMSRYLYQLKYLFPHEKLSIAQLSYPLIAPDLRTLSITKDEKIMEILNRYRTYNSGRSLSPSAIDKYIHCPLQFYLSYVRGYFIDDDIKTYMDEGTYGTIVHEVAEKIYKHIISQKQSRRIENADLDAIIKNHSFIERMITRSVNYYFTKNKDIDSELIGENRILARMMSIFIKQLLRHDKKITPFEFVDGEYKFDVSLPLSNELSINLCGSIDRVDRIDIDSECPSIRLIDYKTGSDVTKISSWDRIFVTGDQNHQKSILQLFLYANAYTLHEHKKGNNITEPVMPMVYKFRDIGAGKQCELMSIAKEPVLDFRDFNDEFIEGLKIKMSELYNPDVPFTPTPDKKACKYCKFTQICDR